MKKYDIIKSGLVMNMDKINGYVTFNNNDVKENDIINEQILVYKSIEDSLRFFGINDDKTVTKVTVNGEFEKTGSKYYGYEDIIIANNIVIDEVLSYEQIIENMLNFGKNEVQLSRFLKSFKLNEEDKLEFLKKSLDVYLCTKYYQDNETNIYKKDRNELLKEYQKIKRK